MLAIAATASASTESIPSTTIASASASTESIPSTTTASAYTESIPSTTTASAYTESTPPNTHDTPATTKPATTKPVAARLCCHGTHWRLHMHGPYCLHQQRCWDELVRYCEIGLHELIL